MPTEKVLEHTFEHAWNDVSLASWKKYPHPARKDVVQLDLLSRDYDAETGVLKTTRLCQAKAFTPRWFNLIFGTPEWVYFVEHATIDPRRNKMVLRSTNVTWSSILQMHEVCEYQSHPERRDWTKLVQTAHVRSMSWGIAERVEKFCLERFDANAHRGREIMENAIDKVKREAAEGLVVIEEMRNRFRGETSRYADLVQRQAEETLSNMVAPSKQAVAEECRPAAGPASGQERRR